VGSGSGHRVRASRDRRSSRSSAGTSIVNGVGPITANLRNPVRLPFIRATAGTARRAGETAALRGLKAQGTLAGAWSPGRPGAVLTLDVPGPDQAVRIVADFPLVKAGQITTEIIPLHPIDL